MSEYHMGKTFNCHHGYFEVPDNIISVEINEDTVKLHCENKRTFIFSVEKNNFTIQRDEEEESCSMILKCAACGKQGDENVIGTHVGFACAPTKAKHYCDDCYSNIFKLK